MGVGVWQLLPPTAEQSFLYKQMNIKRVRLKKAVLHPILTQMRLSSSIFLGKGHDFPFPPLPFNHPVPWRQNHKPVTDSIPILILRIMQKRTRCHSSVWRHRYIWHRHKNGKHQHLTSSSDNTLAGVASPACFRSLCGQPRPKETNRVYTPCCPGLSIPLSSPGRCKPHRKTVPAIPLLSHDPEQQSFRAVSW